MLNSGVIVAPGDVSSGADLDRRGTPYATPTNFRCFDDLFRHCGGGRDADGEQPWGWVSQPAHGPGSEYQIVQRMGHGSRVDVLETKGSWSRVRQQANGAEGWAFRKYLVPEKARSVKRTVYSPGDGFLNMRTGPGSEFKIMRRMYHGDQVDILERKGSWVRVYHPGLAPRVGPLRNICVNEIGHAAPIHPVCFWRNEAARWILGLTGAAHPDNRACV